VISNLAFPPIFPRASVWFFRPVVGGVVWGLYVEDVRNNFFFRVGITVSNKVYHFPKS
jgi:hypothetical protein